MSEQAEAPTTSGHLCCPWCGNTYTPEEQANPDYVDDEPLCDECYAEWFWENSFTCPLCGEEQLDDEESDCFVLFDKRYGEPGFYKALSFPFYSQPLIGKPTMWPWAVGRFGFVPDGAQDDGCPAAFICQDCKSRRWGKRPAAVR